MDRYHQELEGSTSEHKQTASKRNGRVKSIRYDKTSSNGLADLTPSITQICENSKALDTSTSSASDFPVRTFRKRTRKGKALKVKSPVFGMTVGESFAVLDPKSSSLKTVQYSFIKDFEQFSDNLPAQGTMQSGKLFHAKGSACPTCENDFLSLPTPTKSDAKRLIEFKVRSLVKSFLRKQKGNSFFNPNLTEIVAGLIGIKPSAAFLIWMMGYPKTFFMDYWQQRGIQSARGLLRGYSAVSKKRSRGKVKKSLAF